MHEEEHQSGTARARSLPGRERRRFVELVASLALAGSLQAAPQEPFGSIRGVVTDKDFDTPLASAQVLAVELGQKVLTSEQGNYVLTQVPPGRYTLVFTREGYQRQVHADVVVLAGQLTEVDAALWGEFTTLDEFLVQDILQIAAGTEAALLKLRLESPALMDSISAELMSRAGASDAASALKLVAGASLQNGKFAVIRGLPDRYVSSQLNGIRLPSADENTRAVELDLFPAVVIDSLRVSKTFTPDQQGDASGGAVDVRLKAIPDESINQVSAQTSFNTQVSGRGDFLSYRGGGVDFWGSDARDIQTGNIGSSWEGAVGTSRIGAPTDYKWSFASGGKRDLGDGVKLGGLASFFYERASSFYDNGRNDSYWVTHPGDPMSPQTNQGTYTGGSGDNFKTALFDVTQSRQSVRWGGLGGVGVENDDMSIGLTYLYTRKAEDKATLSTDTRGKEYFFPGYDPHDPTGPGNDPDHINAAPYLRLETLEYTERTTGTLQLAGRNKLPFDGFGVFGLLHTSAPELSWSLSHSSATMEQPDKRQFGALWQPRSYNPGFPPFVPPFFTPPTWSAYLPSENINYGNLQRIWKSVDEDSTQYSLDLRFPFKQWGDVDGYFKTGVFDDEVTRGFDQDTFSNIGDGGATFEGSWNDPWSAHFPDETHPVLASSYDVDYRGDQHVRAAYGMLDLPFSESFKLVGGARFESTEIGIVNLPEANAFWIPPGSSVPVHLNPGDADVDFSQDDVLPALGLEWQPQKELTLRASYSQTVARQTFKELSPIIQQEYAGGPVFIGNPDLRMSSLRNYDVRADWTPYDGALVSTSWFQKDITDPIEYVQRLAGFTYTTPINYPSGELSGWEFELRQKLGNFAPALANFACGVNATFISSKVTLPESDAEAFSDPGIAAPMSSRDMVNAPDHLYNAFLTFDAQSTGTQVSLFYTVQGDTLVVGAGESLGNFVPSIYAREYDTLNLSLAQKLGKYFTLTAQAKNLTNPRIREVYRSPYIGDDVTTTSYTKGIEYSLNLGARFSF